MDYLTKCLICGKMINTYNKTKKVCKGECRKIANRLHAKEFMRAKRIAEKEVVIKTCVICHKPFRCLKHIPDASCMLCQVEKLHKPKPVYDETNVDSEGIVYGIVTPKQGDK